jgi:2,4-dienoyl-CoA reductase-like NADH-dependent reductase (Old Yellow Enzyme family)
MLGMTNLASVTASPLAAPITLRSGAILPNRFAKAAMSECLGDKVTGAPTEQLIRLYERWGQSGAGMLLTGNVMVDPNGMGEPGNVVIVDDRHHEMLRRWAEAGQAHGAKMWMQINHAGRQSPKRLSREPVAPSAVPLKGMGGMFAMPRALAHEEIEALIRKFAIAAGVAKGAGFSGVQVHGAHGYLVSQFLSARTNLRDDAWGGDAERRARFLLEVIAAMRAEVGPTFPIGVKLNSADFQRGGFTIEESMGVATKLEAAGVDLLEVSGGNYESPSMTGSGEMPKNQRDSSRAREAYFLDYAQRIRSVTRMPIMLTGGMRSRAEMENALASGAVEVVGLARPMTHAPALPKQLLDGTLDVAPVVKIRSRIKKLDDMLQVMWFQAQIHEMGAGRDPDLALGAWTAIWRGIRANLLPNKKAPRFHLDTAPIPKVAA